MAMSVSDAVAFRRPTRSLSTSRIHQVGDDALGGPLVIPTLWAMSRNRAFESRWRQSRTWCGSRGTATSCLSSSELDIRISPVYFFSNVVCRVNVSATSEGSTSGQRPRVPGADYEFSPHRCWLVLSPGNATSTRQQSADFATLAVGPPVVTSQPPGSRPGRCARAAAHALLDRGSLVLALAVAEQSSFEGPGLRVGLAHGLRPRALPAFARRAKDGRGWDRTSDLPRVKRALSR